MDVKARQILVKARAELVMDHPFFAHLALGLGLREDPGCASAWADGHTLGYNPAYVRALTPAMAKGLLCHEVLHLACGHHLHRGEREPGLWNAACDYAINPVLLEAGLTLPPSFLDDPAHHGQGADAIYAALAVRRDQTKAGALGGKAQATQAQADQADAGAPGPQRQQAGQGGAGGEPGPPEPGDGAAGGGAQGQGQADPGQGDPGMSGEVRDAPPLSDAAGTAGRARGLEREGEALRTALAQALRKGREFGELPGGLERLLGTATGRTLGWRELLHRFLDGAARNDFSWVRPNRRLLHAGLYLPGLDSRELDGLAVAVDVSGSILQAELDAFAAELCAVLEDFDTTLTLFTCDAALTRQERLGRADLPLEFAARGGGGTDFRPPFERLRDDGARPCCLVYFTDLECSRFPEEPDYPVLWVTPNAGHTSPPFGEVLLMESAR